MTFSDSAIVGHELAAVLPKLTKPWYLTPHLLKLNIHLLFVLFSSAGLGFDASMMNGLQSLSTWNDYFNHPSASLLGVINGVLAIGPILFAAPAGWIADKTGRLWGIRIGATIIILSAIMQASSRNVATFATSRFFVGIGIEFCSIPSPVLVTELAYPTHRAKITSLYNTFFFVGAIMSSWSTFGSFNINSTWSWRLPSLLQTLLPGIQLIALFFVPESPRWLVSKGRVEEARAILTKYHANGDENSPLVSYEISEISHHLQIEAETSTIGWSKIWSTAADRKRIGLVIYIAFMAQWSGNGLITYYLSLVLDSVGITGSFDKTLINGILQIFNFFSAIFGALLVDRMGRRPLWMWSIIGMFVSYTVWTACSAVYAEHHSKSAGIAVLALIFIYQFHYAIAVTPFSFSYPVEILPYHNRQKGMAVSYLGNSLAGLVNSFASPVAITAIGWKYYIVYLILLCIFVIVAYLFFPETRGHSLEQIADIFEGDSMFTGLIKARPTSLEEGEKREMTDDGIVEQVENIGITAKE